MITGELLYIEERQGSVMGEGVETTLEFSSKGENMITQLWNCVQNDPKLQQKIMALDISLNYGINY